MITKILGSTLILAASLIFYFEKRTSDMKVIRQVEAYLKLLIHIKNKVDAYGMPIEKVIQCCDPDTIKNCGLSYIQNNGYVPLYSRIENADISLDPTTKKIILDFASEFGGAYATNQLKVCDNYIEQLRTRIVDIKEMQGKNANVQLALSLCITFSLVLILL